jgi:hypothetical protein
MLVPKTLWAACQHTWLAQTPRSQSEGLPDGSCPQLPTVPQRTDDEPLLSKSADLRQKAATATRLAGHISHDPAADRLRKLAADLERQAWELDNLTPEQGQP